MNAEQLKEWLKEDLERIEKLLELSGCQHIWRTGGEIRSTTPDGTNATAVSVNTDTLYCHIYRSKAPFGGDILSLIQHFRKENFGQTVKYIKSVFGLSSGYSKVEKVDPLAVFKKIRRKNRIITDISELEIEKFGMEKLSDYILMPHISLFHEGITLQTQEIFKVGYSPTTDRIIFPHFSYDDINAVVGITGRTLRSKEEIEEFQIPKYFNFIKGYKKMYNLYGFSHSAPNLEESKMLVIFEAEKSVQKQWSMTRNKGYSSSVGGHELSDIQVQIILQNTPHDTEIVIAFDKDVMMMKDEDGKDIGEQYLIDTCNKIAKYRKVSYIFDTYNILGEKDSPVDKGVKIWNHLLKFRKTV